MLSESKKAGKKTPLRKSLLLLTNASHILQELTVSSYVPNNALLMGGPQVSTSTSTSSLSAELAPSMLLLTGPNYSGKSVYMKQVSLHSPDWSPEQSYNVCSGCPYCLSGADREVCQVQVRPMPTNSTKWPQLRSRRKRGVRNHRQDLDKDQYPGECVKGIFIEGVWLRFRERETDASLDTKYLHEWSAANLSLPKTSHWPEPGPYWWIWERNEWEWCVQFW